MLIELASLLFLTLILLSLKIFVNLAESSTFTVIVSKKFVAVEFPTKVYPRDSSDKAVNYDSP